MTDTEFNQRLQDAENGDSFAMLDVAYAYLKGDGTVQNTGLGFKCLKKAANGGNSEAEEALEEMFSEFRIGAEKGNLDSIVGLIQGYLTGLFGDEDFKQAEYWIKKLNAIGGVKYKLSAKGFLSWVEVLLPANNLRELMEGAQKGNANFQYGLGFAYLKGFGTDVNPQQAVYWFQKAAEQGHAGAKQTLYKVSAMITLAGDNLERLNFDQIIPMKSQEKGVGSISKKYPLLWAIIAAAIISYLATGFDISLLHSMAIFFNVSWILLLAYYMVFFVIRIICKKRAKLIIGIAAMLGILMGILTICFSVHYIKGRKTENPISIVLQNPFEAARKHFFIGKSSSESNSEAD